MTAYASRNRILREMGFPSYAAYLASPLWSQIRIAQLVECPHCWGCGGWAKQVHHGDYKEETLRGLTRAALYSICLRCHRAIEFSGRQKLSPSAATRRLLEIRKRWLAGGKPELAKPRKKLSPEQREVLAIERQWGARYVHELLDEEDEEAVG